MAAKVLVKAGRQHLIAVREDTPRFTGVLRLEGCHKRAAELGITSSTIAVYQDGYEGGAAGECHWL